MASAAPSTTTTSQRKLALIIGIGNYEGDKKLDNPENDANDMSLMLERIDFTVTKGVNLTCKEMKGHIRTFEHNIQSGDLVLFYFAGHGKQWEVSTESFSLLNYFYIPITFSSCYTGRIKIT